jgi:hypothetical protein
MFLRVRHIILGVARKLVDKYTKYLKYREKSKYFLIYRGNFCPAIGNTGLNNPTDRLLAFCPVNLSVGWNSYRNVKLF